MTPLTANHPYRSCGGLRRAFFVLALLWAAALGPRKLRRRIRPNRPSIGPLTTV